MKIIHGDCLEKLKELPDNSIDSIVTDPPYGLSFMGKKWDYDVPSEEVWKECLRVLKPGGHLLSFAGTRTQHRMAVRIEDAGFEIRDMIAWVYGSGFPKSLDISKAIDKRNGRHDRDFKELGRYIREKRGDRPQKDISKFFPSKTGGLTGCVANWELGLNVPTKAQWEILKRELNLDENYDWVIEREEAEREVIGQRITGAAMSGKDKGTESTFASSGTNEVNITVPATDQAKQWEGWGTALKPSLEPITVARKPLIGTVAENVLTHGTGGLNIDGSRVGTESITQYKVDAKAWHGNNFGAKEQQQTGETTQTTGRWPANLIHDGSEEVLECFPETKQPSFRNGDRVSNNDGILPWNRGRATGREVKGAGYSDIGSAARFFYCAKASKKDRDEGLEGFENRTLARSGGAQVAESKGEEYSEGQGIGLNRVMQVKNNHPTVKPTALMRYLVKLVTPPGGTVLDPFTGSGSTGKACKLEGFEFIGIEREEEYVKIAEARIEAVIHQPTLV